MHAIAVAFWGAYFGCATLALAGAFVFMHSARRVALLGALAVALSTAYALVFLGWVPLARGEALARLQSITAIGAAAVLQLLLLALLGTFRKRDSMQRVRIIVAGLTAAAFMVSWL